MWFAGGSFADIGGSGMGCLQGPHEVAVRNDSAVWHFVCAVFDTNNFSSVSSAMNAKLINAKCILLYL